MLIETEFDVAAPIQDVWDYFNDVPSLAPCLPGAELTEVIDANSYRGQIISKVGPVSLKFGGTAEIVERDDPNKKLAIHLTGAEAKGKGTAVMDMTAHLIPAGRGTKVRVRQDLQLSGAVAQFGRGLVTDVTTVLMGSFANAVEENLGRIGRGESPLAAARSVGGVGIAIRAARLALMRVFGRLLGIRGWYE